MEKLLISACLLGKNVKYNGKNNKIDTSEIAKYIEFVPICPEVMGGLPIPRVPSERKNDKVINQIGLDVTKNYELGKDIAINIAKNNHIKYALLKSKSPACGNDFIYDGTFSHTLINKSGVTAEALKKIGVIVFNENQIDDLLHFLKTKTPINN